MTTRAAGPILISVHTTKTRPVLVLAIGLCVAGISAPAAAEGESVGTFPTWEERWIHQLINRARCDPQIELAGCGVCAEAACYEPAKPLTWAVELNRAARFHSANLTDSGCGMMHDSPCSLIADIDLLYPDSCDGSVSCACVSGTASCAGGTDTWARIAMFDTIGFGENIAGSSSDPTTPFYLWLLEPTGNSACGFHPNADNGHRYNILADLAHVDSVGTGQSGSYVISDFGDGPDPGKIPSGSHYPRQAATVEVWANWYDTAGPAAAAVNVGGVCNTMSLERGTATNGAWMAEVSGVGSGCHRYYFEFLDSVGTSATYPTTGSLAIGAGAGCPDWDASRPSSCLMAPSQIFADGFESGSTGLWSATVPQ